MLKIKVNNKTTYAVEADSKNELKGSINEAPYELDISQNSSTSLHVLKGHKSYNVEIIKTDLSEKEVVLMVNGQKYTLAITDKYDELLKNLGLDNLANQAVKEIKAPMPGLVLDVMVEPGTEVKKGDPTVVLEAMKMENILKSPADGVVKAIAVENGNAVEKNQVLIHFE